MQKPVDEEGFHKYEFKLDAKMKQQLKTAIPSIKIIFFRSYRDMTPRDLNKSKLQKRPESDSMNKREFFPLPSMVDESDKTFFLKNIVATYGNYVNFNEGYKGFNKQ